MPYLDALDTSLSDALFQKFTTLLQSWAGITIRDYKKYLVEYRLQRLVGPEKRFRTFEELYRALVTDSTGTLRTEFLNALTTNYTYFFREDVHFRFLSYYLRTKSQEQSYLRFWSAGCSTGEEAYSMAITCLEEGFKETTTDIRTLATDISQRALSFAKIGVFPYSRIRTHVPDSLLKKYFLFDREQKTFTVRESLRRMVVFRSLNLMDPYPFQKQFDVVFLRNVLIYFDSKEKEHILENIWKVLKAGGYLILGLSESLVGISHPFTPLKHSIYRKDRAKQDERIP